jgi:histidyl-tRNA synthetase
VPFSIILGEDEVAQGKVKIKENGLREGHPEKGGVMVNLLDLVSEVKARIKRKEELDSLAIDAEGLKVVRGSKEEESRKQDDVPETEKPAEESLLSQEATGAVPAS